MDWIASSAHAMVGGVSSVLQAVTGVADGSQYIIARWVFLRALGLVYLIAFLSLWVQIKGLIGSQGILPIGETLSTLKSHLGPERYRLFPTVFWLGSSDAALHLVCALGVFGSLLLIANVLPAPSLILLWLLYLSLTTAGQDFLSFQWDILLLEAGFLAIFLAPWNVLPGLARETAVPLLPLVLLWWFLFRFLFESGVVKLTSGDSSWWNLTALRYHYETQPLPTWTAWFMHHLPGWFHRVSVFLMFVFELVFPILQFTGRTTRIVSFLGTLFLQLLIFLTGNYNFFNILTVALGFLLLDDAVWRAVLPQGFVAWLGEPSALASLPQFSHWITTPILLILFVVSIAGFLETVAGVRPPLTIDRIRAWITPLRLTSDYGLFRVMTKKRPELIVEGSDDGQTWKPYEFRWKPGDIMRRPRFVEPHQPRLDWQMWFASLGGVRQEQWFHLFLIRLLQSSRDVLGLLAHNPFPDHPPRYVRAMLYDYHFTTPEERRATGAWWKRELLGPATPGLSLQ